MRLRRVVRDTGIHAKTGSAAMAGKLARRFKRAKTRSPYSGAEEAVFRALEENWREHLRGRRIPQELRRMMRTDPSFRAMVYHYEKTGGITLDSAERYVRRVDGTTEDRLATLLGDAPEDFFCECGEEKAPSADLCAACVAAEEHYRK
jgi:hypothetical protein